MNTIISFTYYAKLLSNPLLESWVWQYSLSVNLEQLYAFVSNDWYICPISEVYRSEGIQYTLDKLQVPSYVLYGGFFKGRFSQISSIINFLSFMKILPSKCLPKTCIIKYSWQFRKYIPWKVEIGQFLKYSPLKITHHMLCYNNIII